MGTPRRRLQGVPTGARHRGGNRAERARAAPHAAARRDVTDAGTGHAWRAQGATTGTVTGGEK